MTNPLALLENVGDDDIRCGDLDLSGKLGFIDEASCPFVVFVIEPCGCEPSP